MIFVDTNIWIYYFDRRLPEHGEVTEALEREIRAGIASSTVVLIELAHYFRTLPRDEFRKRIDRVRHLETLQIVELDKDLLDVSLLLLAEHSGRGIGGRDSTILAAMERLEIDSLMSHGNAFKGIKSIQVVDPIATR